MKRVKPVLNPSRKELFKLRLMVVVGIVCMYLFVKEVLWAGAEHMPLYVVLLVTMLYSCLRFLHEWIHYLFITVPAQPKREKIYTVDVFTTFVKGEPYQMIEETLIAIKAITYPHETYLCDESDDPYLKNFCKEHGVHHVTREVKVDAKAGNINNALKQSQGELCVVLDPDHVPFPDFLDPIVDHFNDPEIGFVQIVQAYKNYDGGLIAKGAAQQTFQFYGPIMMTMNKYGTVLAIGANCTFRRTALASIGGHAAGLAEDMHTAMQLHAKGWKSVYVPAVLARGLVPSTLTAYYSQQLKWARGVFDLLVTSYPKLFWKFTWKQKLHYGTIPMHYLSGIMMLMSFMIPVISLILNTSPISIDFTRFFAFALPLSFMAMLIRLYVQKWVMEEEERGFHVVGGLLMIGTWWIFLLGLIYTVLRKKVPYIPTPKDGTEGNNWRLSIPNMVIIAISLFAIVYGLYQDYHPYNLIMSGFAGVNCLILLFSIVASRQQQLRTVKSHHPVLALSVGRIAEFKKAFWLLRRRIYSGVRSSAITFTILIVGLTIFQVNSRNNSVTAQYTESASGNILIPGIFTPQLAKGLTSVRQVKHMEAESNLHFGIISFYLAWGDQPENSLRVKLIDSIYQSSAIPMITWEPWQSLFAQNKNDKNTETKVFANIVSGKYDTYLDRFSKEIKALQRPVFIRFSHEMDNPQYPWSAAGGNTAEEFKAAWKYVHNYFERNRATNVIWVWNPWKAGAVNSYFPGKKYVDWIGVTSLNYASKNPNKVSYSMKELYQPFHRSPVFKLGLPVMLAEMGTLTKGVEQEEWMKKAFQSIRSDFPEIKAFVLFNSDVDKNTPVQDGKMLDWRVEDPRSTALFVEQTGRKLFWLNTGKLKSLKPVDIPYQRLNTSFANQIKGVNYAKGQNWTTNGHALKKKEIKADVAAMKNLGMNTVKYFGLNIYDRTVLNVARDNGIKVAYSFWIADLASFSDKSVRDDLADKILEAVSDHKHDQNIVMWNLANSPLKAMAEKFAKPDLFYAKETYIKWLQNLVRRMKIEDSTRPVSVDIDMGDDLQENVNLLAANIPAIDCFGIVAEENDDLDLKSLKQPYFLSKVSTRTYLEKSGAKAGVFIANWQDEKSAMYVTFDGLKDDTGLKKYEFYRLANHWKAQALPDEIPPVKILRPATTISANVPATFNAVVLDHNKWEFANQEHNISFRWELVKHDRFGNPLEVKSLGKGATISFSVPTNPARYKLNLYAIRGPQVKLVRSRLNIPLK